MWLLCFFSLNYDFYNFKVCRHMFKNSCHNQRMLWNEGTQTKSKYFFKFSLKNNPADSCVSLCEYGEAGTTSPSVFPSRADWIRRQRFIESRWKRNVCLSLSVLSVSVRKHGFSLLFSQYESVWLSAMEQLLLLLRWGDWETVGS